jgi:hypothetical protein
MCEPSHHPQVPVTNILWKRTSHSTTLSMMMTKLIGTHPILFACRINRSVVDEEQYFDSIDNLPTRTRMGLSEAGLAKNIYSSAFHLTMDMEKWEAVDVPFMRQSDVDSFIDELRYEDLIGFDPDAEKKKYSFAFAFKAIHRFKKQDLELTSQYMGYRPLEIVKRTLQNTTQLAKTVIHHPIQRHRQSCFKHLKFPTLGEVVAMDTYYGLVRDVSGWVYGQIYYGCTSHYINVYGMKAKSDAPKTYKAFLRDEGSPTKLHCDGVLKYNT